GIGSLARQSGDSRYSVWHGAFGEIAVAFIGPAAAIACFAVARRKHVRAAAPAALLLVVFAAPPYLYAWWKTGNPVFPFVNSVFRLPYFTNTSLIDARFKAPFTWKTPYEETGRGGRDSPNVPGGHSTRLAEIPRSAISPGSPTRWGFRWPNFSNESKASVIELSRAR